MDRRIWVIGLGMWAVVQRRCPAQGPGSRLRARRHLRTRLGTRPREIKLAALKAPGFDLPTKSRTRVSKFQPRHHSAGDRRQQNIQHRATALGSNTIGLQIGTRAGLYSLLSSTTKPGIKYARIWAGPVVARRKSSTTPGRIFSGATKRLVLTDTPHGRWNGGKRLKTLAL